MALVSLVNRKKSQLVKAFLGFWGAPATATCGKQMQKSDLKIRLIEVML